MNSYKAPLKEIDFIMNQVFDFEKHYSSLINTDELNKETYEAIIKEAAKFSENILAPLHSSGDKEGCHWTSEGVKMPKGFVDAYQAYVEAGWPTLSMPIEYGGQNLPHSLNVIVAELMGQANHAFMMTAALSSGARQTLLSHGDDFQKNQYLTKLVTGEWTGTMCLTEPQCGSDLSFLKTKATDNLDGTFTLTGTKIYISAGDHDMAENIVHIVLARLPDAPLGTKGISLFLVPKVLPSSIDDKKNFVKNNVNCGSIENKMGIHASPTCVLNFDGAIGYLIGKPNNGLKYMFTFMNSARLDTSLQGLTHSELALQGALSYSIEREAGRSLRGIQAPDRPADPLIVHPDIRRMLLTIKSFAEGSRAFIYYLSQLSDLEKQDDKTASQLMGLLTPISKGFLTECGIESANLGIQIYGGHGYIREMGMEQNLRDARISTLYEGTTGIQALDLIGRKILLDSGKTFNLFIDIIRNSYEDLDDFYTGKLIFYVDDWEMLSNLIISKSSDNIDELGSSAFDFLMYSGYTIIAWFWARMATKADSKLLECDSSFYRLKVETAKFYFDKILPRNQSIASQIRNGSTSLMKSSINDFKEQIS